MLLNSHSKFSGSATHSCSQEISINQSIPQPAINSLGSAVKETKRGMLYNHKMAQNLPLKVQLGTRQGWGVGLFLCSQRIKATEGGKDGGGVYLKYHVYTEALKKLCKSLYLRQWNIYTKFRTKHKTKEIRFGTRTLRHLLVLLVSILFFLRMAVALMPTPTFARWRRVAMMGLHIRNIFKTTKLSI